MVSAGDADAMVTGVTRPFGRCFNDITKVISSKSNQSFLSMSMMVSKERTVFIGDVNIHDTPNAEQLANIATGIANTVKEKFNMMLNNKVVTKINPLTTYVKAEDYHQKYIMKNRR